MRTRTSGLPGGDSHSPQLAASPEPQREAAVEFDRSIALHAFRADSYGEAVGAGRIAEERQALAVARDPPRSGCCATPMPSSNTFTRL